MSNCVGALSQLVASGAMAMHLTTNPDITHFRNKHLKHTNFALENQILEFEGSATTGQNATSQLCFHRSGDALYHLFLLIDLPGLAQVSTTRCKIENDGDEAFREVVEDGLFDEYEELDGTAIEEKDVDLHLNSGLKIAKRGVAYYTDAVGQYLPKEITLFIGSQPIDTLFSDYLFAYEELTGRPGRKLAEMVGKFGDASSSKVQSRFARRLYVPVPFWFTKASGAVLPLVSLQFHDVRLKVRWNSIRDAVINGSCLGNGNVVKGNASIKALNDDTDVEFRTVVRPAGKNGALYLFTTQTSSCPSSPVSDSDIKCRVEVQYVYFDNTERNKFADGSFELLIDEVQRLAPNEGLRGQSQKININFNHAVIELLWMVRQKVNENFNENFNFSGTIEPLTGVAQDPVEMVDLRLNNQCRFTSMEGRYFRLVEPYMHHTNVPEAFIYSYSFALSPEASLQPSGSCNFSRIDNAQLNLTLDNSMFTDNTSVGGLNLSAVASGDDAEDAPAVTGGNSVDIQVIARNWNVLKVTLGLAGKAFAN